MGGLVSRYYLEVLDGWRNCRTLITFGTPYRGAVNSLNFLANGYKKSFLDLTAVMRSLPAVYELMPRYPALKVGGEWKRPAEAGPLLGVDDAYARAALDFHFEIDAAIETNRRDPAYMNDPYPIFPVVGVQQATLNSTLLQGGEIVPSEFRPDWLDAELAGGDGTVPRVSATPEDREKDFREIFFAERHASLQCNDQLLTDLVERLKQMQAPRRVPARGGVSLAPRPIGLTVEELYLPESRSSYGSMRRTSSPLVHRGRRRRADHGGGQAGGDLCQVGRPLDGKPGDVAGWPIRRPHRHDQGGSGAPTPVHEVFEVAG